MTQTPDPGPPPRAWYPAPPPPAPRTSGLAVASLVLSLVGIGLLAVVFGACALPDINRGERSGKGLAIAGLVIGIVECAFWFLLILTASAARTGYR